MKVRIGFGLGVNDLLGSTASFGMVVDLLEHLEFDSLWLSERVAGPILDPMTGLAFAAGRTERLKLGTSLLVLPGRNPVLLAKAMASLDQLSGGRFLPVVGIGAQQDEEHAAFGVSRTGRGPLLEAGLATMRSVWGQNQASSDLSSIYPKPTRPLGVWLGGRLPKELQRVGRVADGWLGSLLTPAECRSARALIEQAAEGARRVVEHDHFGTVVLYSSGTRGERARTLLRTFRSDLVASDLMPEGEEALRDMIGSYVDAGISKFVLIPTDPPPNWEVELRWLRSAVGPVVT